MKNRLREYTYTTVMSQKLIFPKMSEYMNLDDSI